MAPKLTEAERKKIIRYLKSGKSHNWIAGEVGRSQSTVSEVARKEGIPPIKRSPKNANEARRHFSREDRMALIGRALDRGAEMLDLPLTPQQYRDTMTGIAIGIDKHRLETGEATSRGESTHRNLSGAKSEELEEFERILRNGS